MLSFFRLLVGSVFGQSWYEWAHVYPQYVCCNYVSLAVGFRDLMSFTFFGSGCTPLVAYTAPKNFTDFGFHVALGAVEH